MTPTLNRLLADFQDAANVMGFWRSKSPMPSTNKTRAEGELKKARAALYGYLERRDKELRRFRQREREDAAPQSLWDKKAIDCIANHLRVGREVNTTDFSGRNMGWERCGPKNLSFLSRSFQQKEQRADFPYFSFGVYAGEGKKTKEPFFQPSIWWGRFEIPLDFAFPTDKECKDFWIQFIRTCKDA